MLPLLIPEPSAVVGVLVAGWLYARGLRAIWAAAGRGRGVAIWRAACFGAGLATIVLALEAPLDALSEVLLSAHMVQHLLLLLVAGPLLVLGKPLLPLVWAMPRDSRRGLAAWWRRLGPLRWIWRAISGPAVAFALHSLAVWAWHVPALYEAALANRGTHVLEHLSFLGTSVLFWWSLLNGGRVGYGVGVLLVFGMALQSTLLGALLTFAQGAWYPSYVATAPSWGLSAQDDQQLAGLIMWVPGGAMYLGAALGLFAAWLRDGSEPVGTPDPAGHTPVRR